MMYGLQKLRQSLLFGIFLHDRGARFANNVSDTERYLSADVLQDVEVLLPFSIIWLGAFYEIAAAVIDHGHDIVEGGENAKSFACSEQDGNCAFLVHYDVWGIAGYDIFLAHLISTSS